MYNQLYEKKYKICLLITFVETVRFRVCPRDGVFGIQVPQGAWHSIEVHEASTIFEAKDGAYGR